MFLVKTPLPTLILLVIGVASLIARRKRADIAVWVPPLLFILAAMFSNLSLGYRLILPVLPFALMIAGQGAASVLALSLQGEGWGEGRSRWVRRVRAVLLAGLVAWLVIDSLSIAPSHLAYFNQLINRDRDYEALVDSNLDWGQDLIALREWQRANNITDLNLAYFGTARPEAYGVSATLLPSFPLNDFGPDADGFNANAVPPGRYAISATSLQLGTLYSRWKLYEAFKARIPEARVGRSFLIYNVAYPSTEIDRAVVLGSTAGDLDRATLGGQADRQLLVKWAGQDAVVVDMHGPARYITRGGEPIAGFAPALHEALIAQAQRLGSDGSGQLRLFKIDARPVVSAVVAAVAHGPVLLADGSALTLPLAFEGGLSLIGYDVHAGLDQPIELDTYWRVDQTPAVSMSIFAHAIAANGQIVAQRDGLNVRVSALEPGDVILQHFILDHPPSVEALEIGLSDDTSGQRMLANQKFDQVRLWWK